MTLSRFGGLICTAVLTIASVASQYATGQEDLSSEPYSVFVAQPKTFARCGPSDEYYRTDALRHGQQLDVYLETADGWLGVRPPESSFCWVPLSAVEVHQGGDSATVIEDRTVSWIGTHLGRARKYRWQVQMAEGEEVSVLGRSERDGPDGPQTWLRIVPPSGEFRWVHRDQIVETPEELVASLQNQPTSIEDEPPVDAQPEKPVHVASVQRQQREPSVSKRSIETPAATNAWSDETPSLVVAEESPELKEAPEPQAEKVAGNVIGSGLRDQWDSGEGRNPIAQTSAAVPQPPVREIPDAGDVASTEFINRPRLLEIGASTAAPRNNIAPAESNWVLGTSRLATQNSSTRRVQTASYQEDLRAGSQPKTVPAANIDRVAQEVRDADVNRLQLTLSRLMAIGVSAAEIDPIVVRARNLSSGAVDQVTAGRARMVGERAQQYQQVARRRDGSTVVRENGIPVIPASQRTAPVSGTQPAGGTQPMTATPPRGDMQTGFLVQVYSARSNSPPFALTDHAGNTVAYVTPSPGINLRGHLNSHIKVIGNRGFLQGLNMPHFLVHQAVRTPE